MRDRGGEPRDWQILFEMATPDLRDEVVAGVAQSVSRVTERPRVSVRSIAAVQTGAGVAFEILVRTQEFGVGSEALARTRDLICQYVSSVNVEQLRAARVTRRPG